MIEFVVKRPVFISVVYFIFIVLGFFAVKNIKIDLLPVVSGPKLIVSTNWPYTSPETIESRITVPVEEVAWKIKGVKNTFSRSAYGMSQVEIEFYKGTNIRFAEFLLKEELSKIKKTLPIGVSGPFVSKSLPEEIQEKSKNFFSFQVIAPFNIQKLREFSEKNILPAIGSVYGVAGVEVYGGSDSVLRVLIDNEKLKALNIPFGSVLGALRVVSLKPVSVSLNSKTKKTVVVLGRGDVDMKDLENLPVEKRGNRVIKLSDIASVFKGYGLLNSLSRVNGMDAVTVTVNKNNDANAVNVSEKVHKKLEELKSRFPFLKFKVIEDTGRDIRKEIDKLGVKAFYIFLCVLISLIVFLFSLRIPLVVILSIILSSIITIDFFFLFRMSVNLITLTGLALGFGMIVDNSIVVSESIRDLLLEGVERKEAVLRGSKSVFGSVFASTFTTIGAFFSFVFISGRMADYYLPLVYSVVISLLSSMAIAFTVIPLFFYYTNIGGKKKLLISFDFLKKPLFLISKAYLVVILLFVFIFNYSYSGFKRDVVRGRFGWQVENNSVYLYVRMPGEADVSTIVDILTPVEREVLKSKAVKEEVLTVHKKGAYMVVKFKDKYKDTFLPLQLKNRIIALVSPLAGITVSVSGIDDKSYYSSPGGIGGYYSSRISISGYVYDKVKEIANYVKGLVLKKSRRVRSAVISFDRRFWFSGNAKEYVIAFKKEFITKHGIDLQDLISYISANLMTDYTLRVKYKGDQKGLEVRFYGNDVFTKQRLCNLTYKTKSGFFKLKQLITIEERKMGTPIVKENQRYKATVMWNYIGSFKGAERYKKKIFKQIELPAGYTKKMEDNFMSEREKKMLYKGYLITVFVIFLILAAYFESFYYPFLVMLSVPFSLVGVFLIFWKGGYGFDSSAFIGLILLFGIVVNDAILYVDLYRQTGCVSPEMSSVKRVRAMLLTTLTTVAGMLPLILGKQGSLQNQDIWKSLGIATVGGLIASTFFTIFFLPSFIKLGENIKSFFEILGKGIANGVRWGEDAKNFSKD